MSSQAFEDGLDLQIGLIAAETRHHPLGVGEVTDPYPRLTPSGQEEMRRFRTILLENDFLRVTFLPGMGGRIISLWDKRINREILRRYPAVEPQAGGRRGAWVREGIQVRLDEEDRPNALGNVQSFVEVPDEESEPAGVWLAENAGGSPVGFHLHATLPSDRAELQMEIRFFNRSLRPVPFSGGLVLHVGGEQTVPLENGVAVWDAERDAGIAIFWDSEPMDGVTLTEGTLEVRREKEGWLGPRQAVVSTLRLVPFGGLGGVSSVSPAGAIHLAETELRLLSVERRVGDKLVLVTESGQTLEAPVDLHPETPLVLPLAGLPSAPRTLVLRDPAKSDLLRWDRDPLPFAVPSPATVPPPISLDPDAEETDLYRATRRMETRALAWLLLAHRRLSRGEFAEAAEALERSLLYNADDPLAWWLRAVALRLAGDQEEERPELLNAHFLAPLEPALRAEAFLASGTATAEGSPIVTPLTDCPEELVEVASLLREAGLLAEANRWIDEALRHRDLPALRVLQAEALLTGTRMRAEAAKHAAAARGWVEPPYPYRDTERRALQTLAGAGLWNHE